MASPKPQLRDAPPIRKIQTDHGAEFAFAFVLAVERRGIRHRYIRPRCPEQNGKVERSHQIDHEEFWSQQSFERFGAASSFEKLSAAISRRRWHDLRAYGANRTRRAWPRRGRRPEGRAVAALVAIKVIPGRLGYVARAPRREIQDDSEGSGANPAHESAAADHPALPAR